ncbi:hypothetical protein BOTBODRAFT_372640 [Botryobasidium botryosum FD-172 SS1]|uniref:Uncharacterized protein n=1 Tax=Botryobasidium botryosum (strain FD-172 SS1) TaxID=930990 RepID=A0A067MC33_BOTB1|nr:hypothetical protein BOTBODRAFT_372640 [Botryobasidium botryosum FD-172 SS1]
MTPTRKLQYSVIDTYRSWCRCTRRWRLVLGSERAHEFINSSPGVSMILIPGMGSPLPAGCISLEVCGFHFIVVVMAV